MGSGRVVLVGAGPGDPDLITLRGLRWLRQAEVVIYDQLASPALLDEASPAALLIFAGKATGTHCIAQSAINALLIHHAEAGRLVVRLKGGDPFVFGRGGEEVLACRGAGIPVEVVPGVSSAVAVPAAAGIPVTHRGLSSSFAVVTGHEDPGQAGGRRRLGPPGDGRGHAGDPDGHRHAARHHRAAHAPPAAIPPRPPPSSSEA